MFVGQGNLAGTLDVLLDPLDVQILHVQIDANACRKGRRLRPAYIDLLSRATAIGTDSVHTRLALTLKLHLLHVVNCIGTKVTAVVWKLSDYVVIQSSPMFRFPHVHNPDSHCSGILHDLCKSSITCISGRLSAHDSGITQLLLQANQLTAVCSATWPLYQGSTHDCAPVRGAPMVVR